MTILTTAKRKKLKTMMKHMLSAKARAIQIVKKGKLSANEVEK